MSGQDRPYVEQNDRERVRMRALIARLTDDELGSNVNPQWTIAGVLGHLAFWDARNLVLAQKLERREPFTSSDDEPEDVTWINDASRPLIHAIPPRVAAGLSLRIAEATDEIVARLPVDRLWPADPTSRVNPLRASHRAEHLDEIEAVLKPS